MSDFKQQLLRLGNKRPDLRDHIRPVLDVVSAKTAKSSDLLEASVKRMVWKIEDNEDVM